jgi:hypothetical protein
MPAKTEYAPVAVLAGVHYDNASKEEMLQVAEISNVLLEHGIRKLQSV